MTCSIDLNIHRMTLKWINFG